MRIVATMLDGTVHETNTSLFQCLADRLAFRQHFGRSYLALAKKYQDPAQAAFDSEWDEAWLAFFDWRCLSRNGYGEDFDTFLATVAEIDHPDVEEPAEEEDTEPDPTPTPGETTSTETTSSSPSSSAPSR